MSSVFDVVDPIVLVLSHHCHRIGCVKTAIFCSSLGERLTKRVEDRRCRTGTEKNKQRSMLSQKRHLDTVPQEEQVVTPTYGQRTLRTPLPRYELPESEMSPQTAYNVVRDELMLDGNARLNLATFVTTWMEPEARLLMAETFDKNMIDKDEYPQTAELVLQW